MFNLSRVTLLGKVGKILGRGTLPRPWILFSVDSEAIVWDARGERAHVPVHSRVVLQGRENIAAYQGILQQHPEVMVLGQLLPVKYVALQQGLRGEVVLATTLQTHLPTEREP